MSFFDAAAGMAADAVDAVSDAVSDSWEAIEDTADEFQENFIEPETGTFTPAPPQPEGPYDPTGVPTRSEILDFVDEFKPPVRDAMSREAAKELYPDYGWCIDMSEDEWGEYKAAFGDTVTIGSDGWGAETHTAFKWHDELEMVLPTVKGMEYYSAQYHMGPDPEAVAGDLVHAGEARADMLVGALKAACEEAMEFNELDGIFHTAEAHANLYAAFDTAQGDLSPVIASIEALGQSWEGSDAEVFREQYADAVRPALTKHTAIALNLSRAADSDLALQVALHFSIAGVLRSGQIRIDELSVRRLFGDGGISVLSSASIAVGVVGLYPAITTGVATAIGLSGLALTGAGVAGADSTLNPKTETIPSSEEIREVMTTMTDGVTEAAQGAADLRSECVAELRHLRDDHMGAIGTPELVPGSGY